jgi:hypothetical protein
LFWFRQLTDEAIKILAENCPHLTSINLSHTELTDAAIKILAEKCPHLTSIHLRMCNKLTDEAIKTLAENCPHLTSIDLSGCFRVTYKAIKILAENCPGLISITLPWKKTIFLSKETNILRFIFPTLFPTIEKKYPHIKFI